MAETMKVVLVTEYKVTVELSHSQFSRIVGKSFIRPYSSRWEVGSLEMSKGAGMEFDLDSFLTGVREVQVMHERKNEITRKLNDNIQSISEVLWPCEEIKKEVKP